MNPTAIEGRYVRTEYAYVRDFTRELHQKHGKDVDLFLHIGQAGGWSFVSIERLAFKQGMSSSWWRRRPGHKYYMIPDDAGKTVEDCGPCPWDNLPMGLKTSFDVDRVAEAANELLHTQHTFSPRAVDARGAAPSLVRDATRAPIAIKPHDEGGDYCCGFIHYESLANCWVNDRSPDVLFCHVPSDNDPVSLERARDAIVAVVVSAARELIERRQSQSESLVEQAGDHL